MEKILVVKTEERTVYIPESSIFYFGELHDIGLYIVVKTESVPTALDLDDVISAEFKPKTEFGTWISSGYNFYRWDKVYYAVDHTDGSLVSSKSGKTSALSKLNFDPISKFLGNLNE